MKDAAHQGGKMENREFLGQLFGPGTMVLHKQTPQVQDVTAERRGKESRRVPVLSLVITLERNKNVPAFLCSDGEVRERDLA